MTNDSRIERAKALARSVAGDERAAASAGVEIVVTLTVAGIVSAFLLPVAISEIVAVETTNWSSGASSLWNIMDLIIVLGVFLFMIGLAVSQS